MSIDEKAKSFAINAHAGQVRKSEKEKPMIIHPINTANILKEYGFDANVVAAGYLHDVVEDTKYTIDDIEKEFGEDIKSLVDGNTEPDKSLSWEERKEHTITRVKDLDIRHKAVVCADKISNLEDLMILFEKQGKYDFSSFKRGYDKQKWYHENVYKSLINNEDENNPMFIRYKKLIDHIFNNEKEDEFIKDTIFKDKEDEYNKLLKLHYRKKELSKLKSILHMNPYIIEFTGTPRTGKTTLMNNLNDFFKKGGFKVITLEEFTTSDKYKKEIYPTLKDQSKSEINTQIPKYVLSQLEDALKQDVDIIMIDRSLVDRMIWIDRLYLKDEFKKEEYEEYISTYIPIIKENIDTIIATYADSMTSLKRDYFANLSLEKRNFLNIQNIEEYNTSLKNIEELSSENNINLHLIDTSDKNQRDISIMITEDILSDMRDKYIKQLQLEFNKEII